MIVALGVVVLVIAVVRQLLPESRSRLTVPMIATALGMVVLIEGAVVLLKLPGLADDSRMTTAAHGIAMVLAGAGIWGIAHRSRWYRKLEEKPARYDE